MKKLIRKILKEEISNRFIDKVVKYIKLPYFKNMEGFGLSEKEYPLVLSKIFNQPVSIIGNSVYDNQRNKIYGENSDGDWYKKEYDADGNKIYHEDSDGYWKKWEYDEQGNEIYYEDSNGYWWKREYDEQGNNIYYETSNGYWAKYEYDDQGNQIYFEDSYGEIEDNRR